MNARSHPLMAIAHPHVLAAAPEELADEYEERAALRTFLGDVDTYEGELAAAREVLERYIARNKDWLPPCE
jgi:hypothetical protein